MSLTGTIDRGLGIWAALLAGTVLAAPPVARVYVLVPARPAELTLESREVIKRFELQLREALFKTGATVVDRQDARTVTILLRSRLEVLPTALRLNLVGVRKRDQKLLGSLRVKAAGSTRDAQLRALVKRACDEASHFE